MATKMSWRDDDGGYNMRINSQIRILLLSFPKNLLQATIKFHVCVSVWMSVKRCENKSTGATGTDLTYLKRCLHHHSSRIIDTLRSQLNHSRVALLFGLTDVLIDLLRMDERTQSQYASVCRHECEHQMRL